jgi:molecular chaperone HscB
MKTLNM